MKRLFLSVVLVTSLVLFTFFQAIAPRTAGAVDAAPPPSGLVGWWPGDGFALDVSGNSNNGALVNGATYAPGQVGQAFSFDGVDDYVTIPHSAALQPDRELTVEGWIKLSVMPSSWASVFWKGNGTDSSQTGNSERSYSLFVNANGSLHVASTSSDRVGIGQTVASTAAGSVITGQWYHVAVVVNSNLGYLRIYLNGVLKGETAYSASGIRAGTSALQFGARSGGGYQFQGLIDEVSLYNRALTVDEITAIYGAGTSGKAYRADSSPTILQQPVSETHYPGESTDFRVAAMGSPRPTYQWLNNNSTMDGQTGNRLQLTNLIAEKAGSYSVRITNSAGEITSDTVTLTIKPIFFPTQIEDFEIGMDGWTTDSPDIWQIGKPTSGPGAAHGGDNCLATVLAGNYPDDRSARMVSPAFTVPTADQNPRLRFWHWWSFGAADFGQVQVSADSGVTWKTLSPQYAADSSGQWTRTTLDLSAYAGQTVRLGFYFESHSSTWGGVGPGWYIDQVEILSGPDRFNNPEDFEASWGDWDTDNYALWQIGVPTTGPPVVNGSRAHSPTSVAATLLDGNYAANSIGHLISPSFIVPAVNAGDVVTLRFWQWYQYGTGDSGSVQISQFSGNAWSDWQTLTTPATTGTSTAWKQQTIDLTAYQGQKVRIGFLHTANSDSSVGAGWYVDDVSLSSFAPIRITLGTAITGSFSANRQSQYYVVNVPNGGHLRFDLTDKDGQGITELYVRRGALPTPGTYDYKFKTSGASQSIFAPNAGAGDWFILAYSDSGPLPGDYFLKADISYGVALESLDPNRIGNSVAGTVNISGAGFAPNVAVSLVNGSNTYPAHDVAVVSASKIMAEFNFQAIPVGDYSLRVTSEGKSAELPFTVFAGGTPNLKTKIIVPQTVGYHGIATIWVEYENTGDAAMPAPLLEVSGIQTGRRAAILTLDYSRMYQGFWTSAMPVGFANSVQFLANGATPGLLQPGESGRVPVYYAGWQLPWLIPSYPPIIFDLSVLTADNTKLIDWPSLQDFMRPPSISSEAWVPVFANLQAQTGTTWGNYVTMLNDNAHYLAKLGQTVTDVSDLLAFEIMQARGLNLSSTLASGMDGQVQAPGLSLSFTRSFGSDIPSRYALGRLGRGWSDNWDYTLSKASDGTVTIIGPNGSRRVFQPDSRDASHYFAGVGDIGVLTPLSGGGFSLTEGGGTVYVFRSDGNLDYVQDTYANRITCTWTSGQLTRLAHSSGPYLNFTYKGTRIETITDSVGRKTTFTYDAVGEHLLTATDYSNKTTTYGYGDGAVVPDLHALTNITLPDGTQSSYLYDVNGRLLKNCDSTACTTYTYDNVGRIIVTDVLGNVIQYYLNNKGQVARTVGPLGNVTSNSYDADGRVIQSTDPAGRFRAYTYDTQGNKTSETDALGYTTRYSYTSLNRLATVTDAKGNVTRYAYDTNGNLISTIYADGSREGWSYDSAGNRRSWTNRRWQTINYTPDASGRVLSRKYPDGTEHAFTYDTHGNMTSYTDPLGTTTQQYYPDGRLMQITYPGNRYLHYTYDSAGRRASMTDQLGHRTEYSYDSRGRLASLKDATGTELVRYAYDVAGRKLGKTLGNGVHTIYTYDNVGQVLELANLNPNSSVLSKFVYTYDSRGRRDTMTTTYGAGDPRVSMSGIWQYIYDDTGQIIGWIAPDGRRVEYTYDPLGNRLNVRDNGVDTAYTVNNLNQYTKIGGTSFQYDADGNLIKKIASGGTTTFDWSNDNSLVRITGTEGTWDNYYDGVGNRVRTNATGVLKEYLIDPMGLGNLVSESLKSNGNACWFIHGSGMIAKKITDQEIEYLTFDVMGNTSELSQTAGATNRYLNLPFGEPGFASEAISLQEQFVGEQGVRLEFGGLLNMRARYYDSFTGRFISLDPIGVVSGIPNLYLYVGNAPTNSIDPSGLYVDKNLECGRIAWNPNGPAATLCFNREPVICENPTTWPKLSKEDQACFLKHENVHAQQCREGRMPDSRTKLPPDPCLEDEAYQNSPLCNSVSPSTPTSWKDACNAKKHPPLPPSPTCQLRSGNPSAAATGVVLAAASTSGGSDQCGGGGGGSSGSSGSSDPNSLLGPSGYGPQNFVGTSELLPYRINFENASTATAPAQNVTVKNMLDANKFDLSTFQLTEIAFGDHFISVPPNTQHFTKTEKMTYNNVTFDVQIEAGIRLTTGEVYAMFQSLDPVTGLPPAVSIGFLPPQEDPDPNKSTGRGQGHVSYIIREKTGLTTGTEVRNVASIVFDGQPAITTDQVDPHDPNSVKDPAKQALITIWTAPLPIVATGTATGIGATTATLTGSVSPNNYPTTVKFEYGLATAYGTTVNAIPSSVTGVSVQSVTANLTGLQPGTTYHYRITGVNSLGRWLGDDATFTTAIAPTKLTISGPDTLNEGSSGAYTATVTWSDGTITSVPPLWSVTPTTYAGITTAGILQTLAVPGANQTITVSASYTAGGVTVTADKSVTILDLATLSLIISGSGSGVINSDPSGFIHCLYSPQTGTCSTTQPLGTQIKLMATPSFLSIFDGWNLGLHSVPCTGKGDCTITMSGYQYMNAGFNQHPPVLLGDVYYPAIGDAYKAAVSGSIIKTQATSLAGEVTINKAIPFTLKGGYNADYSSQTGSTIIQGKLIVVKGSVVIDRVVIK